MLLSSPEKSSAMNELCLATNGLMAMNAQRTSNAPREPDEMQFLKTLFFVFVAVIVALFASRNWTEVTLSLWGDIAVDIKIPLLLLLFFLLGFLPTWLVMRTRLWSYRRRIEALERSAPTAQPTAIAGVAGLRSVCSDLRRGDGLGPPRPAGTIE